MKKIISFFCVLMLAACLFAADGEWKAKEMFKKSNLEDLLERYKLEKTQTETGKVLGMTQVQVSRREKKILDSLRAMLV